MPCLCNGKFCIIYHDKAISLFCPTRGNISGQRLNVDGLQLNSIVIHDQSFITENINPRLWTGEDTCSNQVDTYFFTKLIHVCRKRMRNSDQMDTYLNQVGAYSYQANTYLYRIDICSYVADR